MDGTDDSRLRELDGKIRACRSALTSSTHVVERAGLLKALADALIEEHEVSHSAETVEEAIAIYEEVLILRPSHHTKRAEAVSDLAGALECVCVYHGEDRPWVRGQRCIELLRENLELRSLGHPTRDQAVHSLARAVFGVKHKDTSEWIHQVTECVVLSREALRLRPAGHLERHKSLNNLGVHLSALYELNGDQETLEDMIIVFREVLCMRPPGHDLRDFALNNLGLALQTRFEDHGDIENLTESISLLREALILRPTGHHWRHQTLDNLAGAIATSAELQDRSDQFSESMSLMREALELLPATHPRRGRTEGNLAELLMVAFQHGCASSTVIAEAVELHRKALHVQRLQDNPGLDRELSLLAESLATRFDLHRDGDDLSEAISLQRQSVQIRVHKHRVQSRALQGLANLLCKPECGSWSEAMQLFREALRLCPSGSPHRAPLLSDMARCFLEPSSPSFNLTEGISLLSEAHSDPFCHPNLRLKTAVCNLGRVEDAYSAIRGSLHTSKDDDLSGQILNLYIEVIGLLPRAANFGLDYSTRLQAVSGSDEIARNSAARAMRRGQLSRAVEMLEEGRGIFWSQTLRLRATSFDGIPSKDRQELERLLQLLNLSERRGKVPDETTTQQEKDAETRRQLNDKAEALITKIRSYPGLQRFLLPASFEGLVGALPDGFVVIVNASKLGHHALLLHRSANLTASLLLDPPSTGFDSALMRARLPRDAGANIGTSDTRESRAMRLDNGQGAQMADVLALLWTSIAMPVIRKLGLHKTNGRDRPRLWWCVTGELGFLPIHASGTYQGSSQDCIANYAVCSYIPTLSVLSKARHKWQAISRAQLAGLLICEESSDEGSTRRLPYASQEIAMIRQRFDSSSVHVLNAHSAHTSATQLRAALEGSPAQILHLACHGIQDSEPLKSALQLQDGRLTIEDIMRLDLPHAVLAYLSACQTAKGDRKVPDQAVHLAASMLFCGFRSVVGTMWLMHDEDGPKLAQRFYEALLMHDHLDLDDIPYALEEAITSLRSQGVPAQRWALFMHMGG